MLLCKFLRSWTSLIITFPVHQNLRLLTKAQKFNEHCLAMKQPARLFGAILS